MCSFMVSTNQNFTRKEFIENFDLIKYRGPDMSVTLFENGIWGFHRLAIMDLDVAGMQPFTDGEMKAVCNGEVYNYLELKEELIKDGIKFNTTSDCSVLLPLYKKYGLEMFNKLDSEFALVLYDGKEFIAARDPIGIRSMFYGYAKNDHHIVFASEVKSLINLCGEVYPFPIGHYYYKGQFISYMNIIDVNKHDDQLDEIFKNINSLLTKGIIKRLASDAPIGFLLSGGLDSSLVCSIASKHYKTPIRTFAVGMDKDAIDLKYAKIVSDYIGSIHTEVIITSNDVIETLDEVIYHLETYDITTIRASLGMYLLCKWIHENTDIKVLLTGEVSDELFGYKYTDFAPNSYEFQMESEKRIKELYMYDVLRADRCISGCSLEGRVPFADIDFVKYVLGIDPELKMNKYHMGKYLLRKSFEDDYLPREILYREKAAFSDAVGHSMVDYIKEYADTKYSDDEYQKLIKKYKKHQPFTKESLLYREIFEKYYKDRSDLIVDYWMPNKNWDGCKVNDPSARVLSNYGNSGK